MAQNCIAFEEKDETELKKTDLTSADLPYV